MTKQFHYYVDNILKWYCTLNNLEKEKKEKKVRPTIELN